MKDTTNNTNDKGSKKMRCDHGVMEVSDKVDDIKLETLLSQAENGSDWARRAAWVKIIAARTVLKNRSWCMIAGRDAVQTLRNTISNGAGRLASVGKASA